MRSGAKDPVALGFLVRCMRTPGEAEGLFLREMATGSPALSTCSSLPPGNPVSWSGLTLWVIPPGPCLPLALARQ